MGVSSAIRNAIVRFYSFFSADKKRSKVIFYHDIHDGRKYTNMSTPVKLFEQHIKVIRENGYEIVSDITHPIGQIEICFDDGFLGLYDNIELIKKLNIPVHLFVVSSFLGKEKYMNQNQLLALSELEQIKISSHTNSHKILSQISDEEVKNELKESKDMLEDVTSTRIDSLCYPEGKFNNRVTEIATALGYSKQYSSIPGFYIDDFAKNVKKRSLVQIAEEKEFRAILKGGDHILAFWYKLKHFRK